VENKIGNFEKGFIPHTTLPLAAECFFNLIFVRGEKAFKISPGRTPHTIWITTESGEGGEFKTGAFFNMLEGFYEDNF